MIDASVDPEVPQWPPPRERLCRATIRIISLHNLPKRGELRPKVQGSREACHKFAPKLTTTQHAAPHSGDLSCPSVSLALHTIGGFAAVTDTLPLNDTIRTKHSTVSASSNGLNPQFDHTMHCLAAEPGQTFLRVAVVDHGREVAYETAVVGRLRSGYRVFQLRDHLGTRIDLCYLFVSSKW